ncbi:MAG: SDR family oxidoreductase [Humibacillus sp.]|nr:SDR family oxidoreductase [Humibacillus sp.]MDN5776520.1 SDR family oxidoreductase [Humibacillus sp.]
MSRMQGKVAIVTGAASGIGRATARQLVAEGATVIGADLNEERLGEVSAELGDAITVVAGDLTDPADVDAVAAAAQDAGGADVLVNNAGIMDYFLPVTEVDDETWDRVLAVNATAPMRLIRAVLPQMLSKGGGSIVNVASIGGVTGGAAGIAYTASKHALVGMTKNTAYFYGPQGVRCNVVCPGGVETNIADGGAAPRSDWAWERMQAGFGRAQRMASAEEISSLIVWLSADESVNVNGAVMASDGGWTAS